MFVITRAFPSRVETPPSLCCFSGVLKKSSVSDAEELYVLYLSRRVRMNSMHSVH